MKTAVGVVPLITLVVTVGAACREQPALPREAAQPRARNLLLITIDTLRADRVGAYGYSSARTPTLDAVARDGVRFDRAYAPAPITLTSHASVLSGRYPPSHGARHNGMPMHDTVPTLATALQNAGFATAAFVSAYPLDRQFGLRRGFAEYDDVTERGADGRPLNERPGAETARRARLWLDAHREQRFFLWMHLFDPHAPYGAASASGNASSSIAARYDEDIAAADRAAATLIDGLGDAAASTLVIVTADHGEAFGEHGEIGHSIFVYDTTLRVPLLMRGPGVRAGQTLDAPVSLVDIAPTALDLLGMTGLEGDGISLLPLMQTGRPTERTLYAESFAPLYDFGWSPLRSVREARWKYIAAPKPELYDMTADQGETRNLESADVQRAAQMLARVDRYGPPVAPDGPANPDAANRLRALGYVSGSRAVHTATRADPKDRIALAARIASVTSGELKGQELLTTLEAILREDPSNPQAHLRLGYAELARNRCAQAEPHFRAALEAQLPSADAALGLANCRLRANDPAGAERALELARKAEPDNPVITANMGLVALAQGDPKRAISLLELAVTRDRGFFEARFNLARALAVAGRKQDALREAERLLSDLPAAAPQRPEVVRLIQALK